VPVSAATPTANVRANAPMNSTAYWQFPCLPHLHKTSLPRKSWPTNGGAFSLGARISRNRHRVNPSTSRRRWRLRVHPIADKACTGQDRCVVRQILIADDSRHFGKAGG
jgi:hypothetical protein